MIPVTTVTRNATHDATITRGEVQAEFGGMNNYRILRGDCRQTLKTLSDGSVHCVVTSPPYFGLRDYGVDGQIGLEQTPDEYVAEMVAVFREVRRVLRDDGTLWLNLGDSYAANRPGGQPAPTNTGNRTGYLVSGKQGVMSVPSGLKPKDLIGVPWRVAFALQDDGWYLRSDIIWHKPNPMPESVNDRPTKAHEYIFLLTKSEKYFYDAEAIKEVAARSGETATFGGAKSRTLQAGDGDPRNGHRADPSSQWGKDVLVASNRNKRSVWTVATRPYKGAHFATFPPQLIEPCILAGCPVGGTVLDPFAGSGTTLAVALKHGRDAIGCELNPNYIELIHKRIEQTQPMLILETP